MMLKRIIRGTLLIFALGAIFIIYQPVNLTWDFLDLAVDLVWDYLDIALLVILGGVVLFSVFPDLFPRDLVGIPSLEIIVLAGGLTVFGFFSSIIILRSEINWDLIIIFLLFLLMAVINIVFFGYGYLHKKKKATTAEKIFKFPNGISFSYPGIYEATYSTCTEFIDEFGPVYTKFIHEIGPVLEVSLSHVFYPGAMHFGVNIIENRERLTISDMYQRLKSSIEMFPETEHLQPRLFGKAVGAGKEAILDETFIRKHWGNVFTRSRIVLSDNYIVTVTSITHSKNRIKECREIAQRIESSLKF